MVSNGCIVFGIISVSLCRYEERIGKMADGYSEIYHDCCYIDIHFWRVLAEMGYLRRRCIDCGLYFRLGVVPLKGQE